MTNPVLLHAHAFARRGVPVFPCRPGKKTPATRHGYLDASTDPDQIREWFEHHPDRNLAVVTGAPGPDVLDIDERGQAGSGFNALARLSAAGLLAKASGRTRTPSSGLHIYFAGSHQRTSHLATCHVDFLAQGGYALVPPSQIDGKPYQLITVLPGRGGMDWDAAVRLLEPARERAPETRGQAPGERIDNLARWVADQREGNRNNGLFWAANRALEADHAADLSPLAAAARQAGLTDPEITRTLDSARRTSRAHPEPRGREAEGAS
jgi:Bifunctional DNA primase/polymerase, N-terminal